MLKTFLNLFFVLMVVCACTFQSNQRGYIFPTDIETEIKNIKTTSDLEDVLGSPQVKTINGGDVWVYYGATENYHGPFKPSYDNKTVLLAWVNGNSVQDIKILRDADLPEIEIADGETQIPAAIELNAIQELFNNIGRFSPAGLGQ